MNQKKLIGFSVFVLSSVLFSACSLFPNKAPSSPGNSTYNTISPTSTQDSDITAKPSKSTDTVAAIKTKYGQIVIKLYSQETPDTVANFLKKTNSGFYNNLTFHRVEPGFVVQGGDPKGNGTGGGKIKSELTNRPFVRGSVGLARTPEDKNISNDSQFYICLSTTSCSQLTGDYVNFGEVISGMDAVDQIQVGDKMLEVTTKTK